MLVPHHAMNNNMYVHTFHLTAAFFYHSRFPQCILHFSIFFKNVIFKGIYFILNPKKNQKIGKIYVHSQADVV